MSFAGETCLMKVKHKVTLDLKLLWREGHVHLHCKKVGINTVHTGTSQLCLNMLNVKMMPIMDYGDRENQKMWWMMTRRM